MARLAAKDKIEAPKEWRATRLNVLEAAKAVLLGEPKDCEVYRKLLEVAPATKDISAPLVLMVDDVNELRSMRREWQRVARDIRAGFCQFHVTTTVEKAVAAAAKRAIAATATSAATRDKSAAAAAVKPPPAATTDVPLATIEAIATRLEIPDPLRNRWERYSFQVKGLSSDPLPLDMCLSAIKAAAADPEQPIDDRTEEIEA